MSSLTDFYDTNKTPLDDRILSEKNVLLVVPDKKHDISHVLAELGISRFEIALTWPKQSVTLPDEIEAAQPQVVLQVDCQLLSSDYLTVPGRGEYPDWAVLREWVASVSSDSFVGLHHHDEFSIKDGLGTVAGLLKLLKAQRRSFCCITNHGSIGGWIKQYNACKKAGIKAIFGMESYVSSYRGDDPELKKAHRSANHLVLLANTDEGFYNIIRIHNDAQLNGFYYTPRANREAFEKWGKGIVGLSACGKGEIPQLLMEDKEAEAKETWEFYSRVFDKFYVELQIIEMEEQREVNRRLIHFAKKVGAPLVISNDSHYLDPEYSQTHDVLMCLRQNKTLVDKREKDDVWSFDVKNLYYRDAGSMRQVFENGWTDEQGEQHAPFKDDVFTEEVFAEAMVNTLKIARGTAEIKLDSTIKLPKLYENGKEILRQKVNAGFEALGLMKYPNRDVYLKRLKYEFETITKMGWGDYFLIMEKIIRDTKEKFGEWAITWGRGSAGSSLLVLCLGITGIDPIKYGLLFERFIDPSRGKDIPDIDIDFDPRIRDWVKQHIVELFGVKKVCSIGTYATYKTRAVILDVARALGENLAEVSAVTKRIEPLKTFEDEDGEEHKIDQMDFDEICRHYPELHDYFGAHPEVRRHAEILRNQVKNMGTHAGGVIISDLDLQDRIPVLYDKPSSENRKVISAWAESGSVQELSSVGLVKYDLLGLASLTIISDCIRMIETTTGTHLARKDIPIDDREAILQGSKKDLVGIFQFENPVTKPIADAVGMESLMDVAVVTSLIRPGPMDAVINGVRMPLEFARRKHGGEYESPEFIRNALAETHSLLCFDGSQLVYTSRGPVVISDVGRQGERVACWDHGTKESLPVGGRSFESGYKNVFRYNLSDGRSIVCTPDHLMRLRDGSYVSIDDIYNQRLPLPWVPGPILSGDSAEDWRKAYLYGLLIGDGTLQATTPIVCCGSFRNNAVRVKKIFDSVYIGGAGVVFFATRCWYVRLGFGSNAHKFGPHKNNPLLNELRRMGLCVGSKLKRVPFEFLGDDRRLYLSIIAGLIDSDGSIRHDLRFSSSNRELLEDFSYLCWRLGYQTYRSGHHSIVVESRRLFGEIRPYLLFKKDVSHPTSNGLAMLVDGKFAAMALHSVMKGSLRTICRKYGLNDGTARRIRNGVPVCKRMSLGSLVDVDIARSMSVVTITGMQFLGKRKVFDLSMDENFVISPGLVVHNCFQENIMLLSRVLSGFTASESNALRKASAKKQVALMSSIKEKFIGGAQSRIDAGEITQEEVVAIWGQIETFANYSFPQSHAVEYGAVTTVELWLKYHYPIQFIAALVNNTKLGKKKHGSDNILGDYLRYARRREIPVLGPDINMSGDEFRVENNSIRFALGHVKGVATAAKLIEQFQPFASMQDFYDRVKVEPKDEVEEKPEPVRSEEGEVPAPIDEADEPQGTPESDAEFKKLVLEEIAKKALKGKKKPAARRPNRRVVESLIAGGAFDRFGTRNEMAMEYWRLRQKKKKLPVKEEVVAVEVVEEEEYAEPVSPEDAAVAEEEAKKARKKKDLPPEDRTEEEWQEAETEVIGMCLSRPVLYKQYEELIRKEGWYLISEIDPNKKKVLVFGEITSITQHISKAGNSMHIVTMTDGIDSMKFFVFQGGWDFFRDNYKSVGAIGAVPLARFDDGDGGTRFFDDRGKPAILKKG